jgi:hypothetical protein
MINQQLLDYINTQLERGIDTNQIRQTLLDNGWQATDIDTALASRVETPTPTAPTPSNNSPSQSDAVAQVGTMGKFRGSWTLFTQSLNLLRQDKEVVLFPVLSSIVILVVTALFVTGIWLGGLIEFVDDDAVVTNDIQMMVVLFAYYVTSFFIATYFKVGLTAVVFERINGRNIDFSDGISRANQIAGKILVWSLITSTVGMILRFISERSRLLGK